MILVLACGFYNDNRCANAAHFNTAQQGLLNGGARVVVGEWVWR